MSKYIIKWTHKTRHGNKGAGTKAFEKHEAELVAAELNRQYPHIDHKPFQLPTPTHYPGHD